MLTNQQVEEIRTRCEKATPGEWIARGKYPMVWDGSGDAIVSQMSAGSAEPGRIYLEPDDAEFIAHSRTDIPALLADREEMQKLLREAVETLDRISMPLKWMLKDADSAGLKIDGRFAAQLSESADYAKEIARKFLYSPAVQELVK